ncbi:sulfatase-like hydrolase/transferase [Gordonia sp. VNK1]|uniref:sulfatase-like hydrolase/transferase n=1 Tax=Gordonia oleivorans TaxID=3156618 RepID=UPI0032B37D79
MSTSHGATNPRVMPPASDQHNIVFVFTDQERYFEQWPDGMSLPGRERMMNEGVNFRRHYASATMCTSSRAVMLTGLQTADNKMFDNTDLPFVAPMSYDLPTIGDMLRSGGYYTAYKGKWHLNAAFDVKEPEHLFTKEMNDYGFSDFVWPGDVVAGTLGGYNFDTVIGGTAVAWLRNKGRPMADEQRPWALFVSLVNPHDIMYFDTDEPGQPVQDTGDLLFKASPAPANSFYDKTWGAPIPTSLSQPFDEPGRPSAHGEFDRAWGYALGRIPAEEARWQRFSDFYLNSIRSVDTQLEMLLRELDNLGLSENTIVVFTSDHGEMGGAHGLRGKGPFAYEEGIHLPMHIRHPDVRGGQTLDALTSHIDLVPSLLSMAGVSGTDASQFAGRDLPGYDFSNALGNLTAAPLHSVRDSLLFTYSGIATNDAETIGFVAKVKSEGGNPLTAMAEAGRTPDLMKRGSLRTMFDGRYKFTRYFSPMQRNSPVTIDDLYRFNDVELYDLETDPNEMTNLAVVPGEHEDLVMQMSDKLEENIRREIGVDDGREMPHMPSIEWHLEMIDL